MQVIGIKKYEKCISQIFSNYILTYLSYYFQYKFYNSRFILIVKLFYIFIIYTISIKTEFQNKIYGGKFS